MTGLNARTGRSLRLVRTVIEVSALAAGFALGGTVGIGTVGFALLIGPGVQATSITPSRRCAIWVDVSACSRLSCPEALYGARLGTS